MLQCIEKGDEACLACVQIDIMCEFVERPECHILTCHIPCKPLCSWWVNNLSRYALIRPPAIPPQALNFLVIADRITTVSHAKIEFDLYKQLVLKAIFSEVS